MSERETLDSLARRVAWVLRRQEAEQRKRKPDRGKGMRHAAHVRVSREERVLGYPLETRERLVRDRIHGSRAS